MKKLIFLTFVLMTCFVFKSNAQSYSTVLGSVDGYNIEEDYISNYPPSGVTITGQELLVFITQYGGAPDIFEYSSTNDGSYCYVQYDTTDAYNFATWEINWTVYYSNNTYETGYFKIR